VDGASHRFRSGLLLPLALCAQAPLLFYRLDLLDAWGDEIFTQNVVSHSIREIVPILQHDVHPPLYFFLLHAWMRIPLPWTGVAALRAFSAVVALLSTILLDQFWLRHWRTAHRALALGLFVFSPCLLLYGRMARSYSMQTALGMAAFFLLWRWAKDPRAVFARALPAWAAVVLLLYTHYLPGLAVLAGFTLMAAGRLGLIRVATFFAATLAAYAPWIPTLAGSLDSWRHAAGYDLTRSPLLEQALKLTFAITSLSIGESFAPVVLVLVPPIVWIAWRGWRVRALGPSPQPMIAVAAMAGYIGAARWVAWPFVAARLLWLLPFLTLALTIGLLRSRPAARFGLAAAILLACASSTFFYFRRENFVNLGYAAPMREIAGRVRSEASSGDAVLADTSNTDFEAIQYYLGSGLTFVRLDGASARQAASAGTIWIIRNTHDVSAGGSITAFAGEACRGRARSETFYEPYPAWERIAMRIVTGAPAPQYFYQLTVCR
jgi:hypothetical protein